MPLTPSPGRPRRLLSYALIGVILILIWPLLRIIVILLLLPLLTPLDYPDDLRFGMSTTELKEIAGEPDADIAIGACNVWYFKSQKPFDDDIDPGQPEQLSSPASLPSPYGHFQLLFDTNSKLIAYTYIGEELNIHTSTGDYPGSRLQELPEEFWVGLRPK